MRAVAVQLGGGTEEDSAVAAAAAAAAAAEVAGGSDDKVDRTFGVFGSGQWQAPFVGKCQTGLSVAPKKAHAILFYSQVGTWVLRSSQIPFSPLSSAHNQWRKAELQSNHNSCGSLGSVFLDRCRHV